MSAVELDPSSVPVYPVLRLALREAEDGDFEGLVDDELVSSGSQLEMVRASVMKEAARRAADRPGQAIRARGTGPDGAVFELVVPAKGDPVDAAAVMSAKSRQKTSRSVLIAGGSAAGAVVAVIIVALVLILSGSGSHTAAKPSATSSSVPAPTPTQLPVNGPPGWSSQASWSVPSAAQPGSSGASAASDDSHVFALPAANAVASYAAATGQQAWRQDVRDTIQVGPVVTSLDGKPAVVAATAGTLYAWVPRTGHPIGSWKLPAQGAQVRMTSTGPVVLGQGRHAYVVVGDRLAERVLPATGDPVAPGPSGALLVAGAPGQVWAVGSATVAGSPVALQAPPKYTFSAVVGSTNDVLVAAFAPASSPDGQQVLLRAFRVGSWAPLWTSSKVPAVQTTSSSAAPLLVSPDNAWGTYGSTAITLSSGKTSTLPSDWMTSAVGDRVGFGTSKGEVLAMTRTGLTAASEDAAKSANQNGTQAVPPAAVSGTSAVLLAQDGQVASVYLVRTQGPDATAGASTSSVSPAPSNTAKPSHPVKSGRPSAKPKNSAKHKSGVHR